MIRKALTYLTILAVTALPVQLISARVDVVGMEMNMSQSVQLENDCMSAISDECDQSKHNKMDKACCDDQSHTCDSCDNCPQAVTAMFSSSDAHIKTTSLKTQKHFISYSFLSGVSQENLLRPPRTLI